MELNENIMQLIVRQLNNEASPEEKATLASWLGENPAHQQEYDAYAKMWEESANIATNHPFNTNTAWEKVQKKILHSPEAVDTGKSKVISLKRFIAAAAVLILVSSGIYFYFINQKPSWNSITALNTNKQVTLPDGTSVLLRKGSTLRYPESFGKNERTTELNGEGYFSVTRDEHNPFKVLTSKSVVEVLGTSFLVRNTDIFDEVVVNSGKVQFSEREDVSQKVILTKGQKATFAGNHFVRDTVQNTNYLSWENGKLVFHNTPLKDAVADISDLFNVEIAIDPGLQSRVDSITIKATFEKQTIGQIMDEIQLMTGLKVDREKGKFILRK